MNAPTFSTRFIGTPGVAKVIYLGSALCVLFWLGDGGVPWWVALGSLFFAGTARKASVQVRRYDAWAGEWNAMAGGFVQAAPREAKPRPRLTRKPKLQISSWVGFTIGSVLWFAILFMAQTASLDSARRLVVFWLGLSMYLAWRLIVIGCRAIRRKSNAAVRDGAQSAMPADVVQWVLPQASSSTSRAEMMRRLPTHCAPLIAPAARSLQEKRLLT